MLRYILTLLFLVLITITSPHTKAESPLDTTLYQEQGYNAITTLETPSAQSLHIFNYLLTPESETTQGQAYLLGALESITENTRLAHPNSFNSEYYDPPQEINFQTTVRHLWKLHRFNISCSLVIKEPRFAQIALELGMGDHNSILNSSFGCSNDVRQIPQTILDYYDAIDATGSRAQVCGSSSLSRGRLETHLRLAIRFAPRLYLTSIPRISQYDINQEPLEFWGLYSAWNFRHAEYTRNLYHRAINDLQDYYLNSPEFNLTPEEAEKVSRLALLSIGGAYNPLPAQFQETYYMILNNFPLTEIEPLLNNYRLEINNREDNDDISIPTYYAYNSNFRFLGNPESYLLISVFRPDVTQWLLEIGDNPNQTNRIGKTALMTAAHLNQLETINLLLEYGANINQATLAPEDIAGNIQPYKTSLEEARNYWGDDFQFCTSTSHHITHGNRTALMYAAENASAAVINILLEHGADICLADSEGLTALNYFSGKAPSGDTNNLISESERIELAEKLTCLN